MSDVTLYEEIGYWGVSAAEFSERLVSAGEGDITLRVNSAGGDVYAGLAIMNQLRNHPGKVTAYVEGLAASAASFIVVGGADEVIMCPNSEMMIHDAMTFAEGNADDISSALAGLERASENIASIYAAKAGGDPASFREAMKKETWFTAEEAVLAGLADRVGGVVEPERVSAMSRSFALMNKFKGRQGNPPADLIHKGDEQMADQELLNKMAAQIEALQNKINGLFNQESAPADDPSEADVEDLEDGIEDVDQPGPGEAQPEPGEQEEVSEESEDSAVEEIEEADEVEQPSEGEGELPAEETVTIDAATYAELRAAAELGWAAAEEKAKADRAAEVDQWVADGRISAALRNKAVAAIERDADAARATYGSNPKNTVPRQALGHAVDDEESTEHSSAHLSKSANASGLFGAPTF